MVCVVGGALVFGFAGLGVVACSGDDTNPAAPVVDSGPDSTTSSGQDGSTSDANGSVPDTGSDTGADAGADGSCDKQPTLHAAGSGGPYCPFIDGGEGENCAANQLCCLNDTNDLLNGSCQTTTACPSATSFVFQCSGPSNCNTAGAGTADGGDDAGEDGGDASTDSGAPTSMVCCGLGPVPTVEGACPSYDLESDLSATVCATTCTGLGDGGAAALIICDTATGECPSGTTCVPFRVHGAELGYCM